MTDNTADGDTRFRSDVSSANSNAEFFEHHITSSTASYPIEITGSNNTKVYLKISRGGSASSHFSQVGQRYQHAEKAGSMVFLPMIPAGEGNSTGWGDQDSMNAIQK